TVASGRIDSVKFAICMSAPTCRNCAALTLRSRSPALLQLQCLDCDCYARWGLKQASQLVIVWEN
ncbi:MAG TPA: hypothetical protein VFP11_11895, partial [Candidatus Angelobacter sp.]|nr:hypothetical protein [Candidatus Angelobacter sp.]